MLVKKQQQQQQQQNNISFLQLSFQFGNLETDRRAPQFREYIKKKYNKKIGAPNEKILAEHLKYHLLL